VLLLGAALVFSTRGLAQDVVDSQSNGDGQWNGDHPVYQQHAFDGHRRDDRQDRRDFRRSYPMFRSPQVTAGWFQRPYPYHLDYYKMRYGGSYAPYFGNLYGTPQAVYYPPYYGPYYGGNGALYPNDYGQGYGGLPAGYPAGPNGVMPGTEVEEVIGPEKPAGESAAKAKSDTLPAPKP
jgi:hypothetical protein